MTRFASLVLFSVFFSAPAHTQGMFDPATAAYALCVTHATKQLAVSSPRLTKDEVIGEAFRGCGDTEKEVRTSLTKSGVTAGAIEDRLQTLKKFIRLNAPDDIDRYRANEKPR